MQNTNDISCCAANEIRPHDDGEPRILVVDDHAAILEAFRKILGGAVPNRDTLLELLDTAAPGIESPPPRPRFLLDRVGSGQEAWELVRTAPQRYAVAFVDMRMPGGWDGLRTIEELWRVAPGLQVVVCTAYSDYAWEQIVARLGRSDRLLILRKPFEAIEVLQLAAALSEKWRLARECQTRMDELEQRVAERTRHLEAALAKSRAYERELHHQATHDALTGLPNRSLLDDRIAQCIAHAQRSGQRLAVLFADLDRFKFINDSFGHPIGDALLEALATRLQAALRETDTVARLGGDEFAIVLSGIERTDDVSRIAQKVLGAIAQPIELDGCERFDLSATATFSARPWCGTSCSECARELRVTASIGVAVWPDDGASAAALLKHADAAMYRAKEAGGNAVQFYAHEMGARALERVALETALHRALERQEFELHYQPKVELRSGRIAGVEALVRWRHPELGLVAPARFIALAEETGLIVPIGEWVLRTACAQAKTWHDAGYSGLSVAVNVSARQFAQLDVPELVRRVLAYTGLAPGRLDIELTESVLLQDGESTVEALRRLKALGVTLSLDDFGTGYSSLSYLRRFPIDAVKIDRFFIGDVTRSVDGASITKAIIAMARSLEMTTVAEGVETAGQLAFLRNSRCDAIQGHCFSAPLPAHELEELLREGRLLAPEAAPEAAAPTLLLVDDEINVLAALKRQLRRSSYPILSTTSPIEALELLATHRIGVIVSDARMPEMSGIELLRRVSGLHPDVTRIMLSGHTEFDAVTSAINDGAVHKFLAKPWDERQLHEYVADGFRRHETETEQQHKSLTASA